jgi:uncharacterized protein
MQYQKVGDAYILRLLSGERAIAAITEFLTDKGAGFASLSGIGAVRSVELAYWNASTEEYEHNAVSEQMEVVSLSGNCSIRDGKPFLHVHGVFGRRDFTTLGGHITEAEVHPTLEVWLRPDPTRILRSEDPSSGLFLLDLSGN